MYFTTRINNFKLEQLLNIFKKFKTMIIVFTCSKSYYFEIVVFEYFSINSL